jgi:hypothetical protein
MMFCFVSCERDDWQDYLTQPGLGGDVPTEDPLTGLWSMLHGWDDWLRCGDEWGLCWTDITFEDGEFSFRETEVAYEVDYTATGTYELEGDVLKITATNPYGDPHWFWNRDHTLTIVDETDIMLTSINEYGEEESIVLRKAGEWVGNWQMTSWWATDAAGATIEGPEEWEPGYVGFLNLKADGTYEAAFFSAVGLAGAYTYEENVLTLAGDLGSWWGQPWTISFDEEGNMFMGVGTWPTGEGEGYTFQKAEE